MIATSICARGLDIKAICLVVNFKCPNHLEDYIHRIGRTGRAGTKGTAITFITPEEEQYSIDLLKALEMSDIRPPEDLIKLSQGYLAKVKKGEARKIRNKNLMGSGFKFD
jgi:ATP-dependent RNA helicase DDX46/PRP5